MCESQRPKLSLLAQFDDLNRLSQQLSIGIEEEFLTFVKHQQLCNQNWSYAIKTIDKKELEILKAKKAHDILETKLKHTRSLVETEMRKKLKIEYEKQSLERQIALIKEVLLADQNALNDQTKEKLAFLNSCQPTRNGIDVSPRHLTTIEESIASLLSPSDVSFDKTDDDLDIEPKLKRSKSKRGSSRQKSSSKRTKFSENYSMDDECSDSASLTSENKFDQVIITTDYATQPALNTRAKRCCSEPVPNSNIPSPPRQTCKSDNDPFDTVFLKEVPTHGLYPQETLGSTPSRRFSSTGKMNRNHVFCTKTVIRPEKCYPCGERIRFYKQALKCQDCRVTCHPECKNKVPLPCYPSTHTPTNKGMIGTIADYAPTTSPMIPAILIHCINEIESRGLSEVGLYRISGGEREVKDLKEKFLRGKGVPCLSKIDIHAVCGAVKEFLRSLREPLITRNLWKDFVKASEIIDAESGFEAACEAVNQLPQPNRDTLAFLIMHLKCVGKSPKCKMPIDNLAKVFGPTVVGYSVPDPSNGDMLSETKSQCMVMQLLLKIPADFWRKFVFLENSGFEPDTPAVVEPDTESKWLGPSGDGSISYKSRGVLLGKTPLTPRNDFRGRTTRQKKTFFASPLLK